MPELCTVPGCLKYASIFRMMKIDEDRHYVGFCASHAKLGPYEQRRLL